MATKKHNENAEWINNITRELERLEVGPKTEIHINLLKTTMKRIPNWETPFHDGIHDFWFKKFTYIHGRQALEMNRFLQGAQVPNWVTKGKTILIQKDASKFLKMDQRKRKLMIMNKALVSRDDVGTLCVSRKEGGRGLASIKDSVGASIQKHEDYIEKHERGLITAIRNDTDNTIDYRMTTTRK